MDADRLLLDYSVANGHFGVSLYKEMVKTESNFAFSPFSVHSAMSMLLMGAHGPAKREMIQGLHIQSPVNLGFQSYNQSLDHGTNENATLMIANAVYTKTGFHITRGYVNRIRTFYQSQVNRFAEENPEDAINAWVSSKTNQMIPEFLQPGDVPEDMMVMLLNAVYFKAMWAEKFDPEYTSLQPFTDKDGESHEVYMMSMSGDYKTYYSETLGATALRIPYKGDRYSFNIILPREDHSLSTVEARLTHEVLNETLTSLGQQRANQLDLQVPKFSMDTEASMVEMLRVLGINRIFDGAPNSFRRMSNRANLKVDEVKHRCIVELDEEGTEAAAVTGVGIVGISITRPFTADRPFMFVLRDDEKAMNLFMGRYAEPYGDNLVPQ